jgi:hypothetical protein
MLRELYFVNIEEVEGELLHRSSEAHGLFVHLHTRSVANGRLTSCTSVSNGKPNASEVKCAPVSLQKS